MEYGELGFDTVNDFVDSLLPPLCNIPIGKRKLLHRHLKRAQCIFDLQSKVKDPRIKSLNRKIDSARSNAIRLNALTELPAEVLSQLEISSNEWARNRNFKDLPLGFMPVMQSSPEGDWIDAGSVQFLDNFFKSLDAMKEILEITFQKIEALPSDSNFSVNPYEDLINRLARIARLVFGEAGGFNLWPSGDDKDPQDRPWNAFYLGAISIMGIAPPKPKTLSGYLNLSSLQK